MPEIILRSEEASSVKRPDTYSEVSVHPVTKRRGRFAVRLGKPVYVWHKKERRMKWIRRMDVEELPPARDDSVVLVISQGSMGVNDFPAISEELAAYRKKRRRNAPVLAPREELIREACREIRIRGEESWTVGDHTFKRPAAGLLIPRNAEWARALALESQRPYS